MLVLQNILSHLPNCQVKLNICIHTYLGLHVVHKSDAITNCCLDYDDQSSHTSVIRAHYVYLLEKLDVKFSGLVDQLYSDQVVGAAERDDISAERTSFTANEKLLSVLSRKSPQQFQLFLDALDSCGQPHVRNVIDDRQGMSIKITDFTSCTHKQLA